MKPLTLFVIAAGFGLAFLIINFAASRPYEVCDGSHRCVVDCDPWPVTSANPSLVNTVTAKKLTGMCCDDKCSPAQEFNTCTQSWVVQATNGIAGSVQVGTTSSCTCLQALYCTYTTNSSMANLSLAFLLIALLVAHRGFSISDLTHAGQVASPPTTA
jgi:hypothetical protein